MRGTAGVSTSNHQQLLAFSVYSTVSTRYSSQNSNSSISCIKTTCRGCKNVTQCRPCSHVSNPSEPAPISLFLLPSRNSFFLLLFPTSHLHISVHCIDCFKVCFSSFLCFSVLLDSLYTATSKQRTGQLLGPESSQSPSYLGSNLLEGSFSLLEL